LSAGVKRGLRCFRGHPHPACTSATSPAIGKRQGHKIARTCQFSAAPGGLVQVTRPGIDRAPIAIQPARLAGPAMSFDSSGRPKTTATVSS
jgi:hypothetical protein